MSEMKRKTLLIVGIIIAVIATANNIGFANTNIEGDGYDIVTQTEQLAQDILKSNTKSQEDSETYKVYNNADQLVYQTTNKKDTKLTQLIQKSDFITEVDKITYYKLSR